MLKILSSRRLVFLWLMFLSPWGQAANFSIEDIEVVGLQRISQGTLFTYLPVKIGDQFDDERSATVIHELFKTGFFKNISLSHRDNVLVVHVAERPAISELNFDGNKDIKTEQLEDSLRSVGISKGKVFNRSLLAKMELELQRLYYSRGKYGVRIKTEIEDLERNRVAINLDISEGRPARIRHINIVGNKAFDEEELMKDFESGIPGSFSFFSSKDEYSKPKLAGDLEALRSFYLDRGYMKFEIESTQVTITPDNKDIYITVNIIEGVEYAISDIKLSGNLSVDEQELQSLIDIAPGDIFSRKRVGAILTAIERRLGDEGFAFANVKAVPDINEADNTVALNLFVDPGKRAYVRRISFSGNDRTRDNVLRREMRQMEGAWFSAKDIDRSKVRLQRLSYIEQATIETPKVPGTDDQVDLNFDVKERLSGSFTIGMGYSQTQGLIFTSSISQENLFGTGKRLSANIDTGSVQQRFDVSYTDPYHTIDGVSRGLHVNFAKTDAAEANITSYLSDSVGTAISYGIPLTEYNTLHMRVGVDKTDIITTPLTSSDILDFIAVNGREYSTAYIRSNLNMDTRNRTIFPDTGSLHRFSAEINTGDLDFYKLGYNGQFFFPATEKSTVLLKARLGYGDSFGKTTDLPFFRKYFAGGLSTVRGYNSNSLGPRDSSGNPFGGNMQITGGVEYLFTPPFMEESGSFRMAAFYDVGNVFARFDDFEADELRTSYGLAAKWFSPIGPLVFSLAEPLNEKVGDDIRRFEFSLGRLF